MGGVHHSGRSGLVPGTPKQPGVAMAGLRSATWPCHQRLEKRLHVRERFSNVRDYGAHLQRMWGFCAPLEERLSPKLFGDALPDFESRRKTALLARDLIALGADAACVAALPRCRHIPRCEDVAGAFGSLYVFEGATQGGRTLLPLVENLLGLSATSGASFLASYGDEVPVMWRRFAGALESWCADPPRRAVATAAAVATFEALEDWLCGEPA